MGCMPSSRCRQGRPRPGSARAVFRPSRSSPTSPAACAQMPAAHAPPQRWRLPSATAAPLPAARLVSPAVTAAAAVARTGCLRQLACSPDVRRAAAASQPRTQWTAARPSAARPAARSSAPWVLRLATRQTPRAVSRWRATPRVAGAYVRFRLVAGGRGFGGVLGDQRAARVAVGRVHAARCAWQAQRPLEQRQRTGQRLQSVRAERHPNGLPNGHGTAGGAAAVPSAAVSSAVRWSPTQVSTAGSTSSSEANLPQRQHTLSMPRKQHAGGSMRRGNSPWPRLVCRRCASVQSTAAPSVCARLSLRSPPPVARAGWSHYFSSTRAPLGP